MGEWTKHTGTGKPSGLADAQMVWWMIFEGSKPSLQYLQKASDVRWNFPDYGGVKFRELYFRPYLDPDGLPYVSAQGLEPWAEYVHVEYWGIGGATAVQFPHRPTRENRFFAIPEDRTVSKRAPNTHALSICAPEHSLARVWRESWKTGQSNDALN